MPKVSIIIPVYNVEPYLRKALDSVVNQTLRDIEIICINDCSSDNSLAILEDYAQRDSRIKIINQETNQGQGVARNLGMDVATGEYLTFLDPDDWLELNACEILYNAAQENSAKVVRAAYTKYYEDKTKSLVYVDTKELYEKRYKITFPKDNFFDIRSVKDFQFYFIEQFTWGHLYLTSFVKENNFRFSPYRKAEDHLFRLDIKLTTPILHISNSIYNYFIRKNSSRCYSILYEEIIEPIRILRDTKYQNDEYARDRLNDYILRRYDLKYRNLYNYCFPQKFLNDHKGKIEPEIYTELSKMIWRGYVKGLLHVIFSLKKRIHNNHQYKVLTILGIRFKWKCS